MDREEIASAIREADERLERLRPRLIEGADRPLPSGEWRVRDALSHLAARGNPVPRALARLEETTAEGTPPPAPDVHAVNAQQVSQRADRDVAALLDELREGHRAALDMLPTLAADTLARRFAVPFPPGELSLAEFIVRAGPRHEANHLDDIEAALG